MAGAYGGLMLADIQSQIAALDEVAKNFCRQSNQLDRLMLHTWFYSEVILTGCGATYALALTAASLYRRLGYKAAAIPASEVYFFPEVIPISSKTLIAFSRSGETSETLKAVEQFHKQRPAGKVIAITADLHSSLALSADLILDSSAACDTSMIETKSFSGMFLVSQLLIAWLQQDNKKMNALRDISKSLEPSVARLTNYADRIGNNKKLDRFFFLGSGPLFGIVYQASLTLKECAACWSEAFQPLEFRHGPRTTATDGAFVCLFASNDEKIAVQEKLVVEEMKDQGASILVFTEQKTVFADFQENELFCFSAAEAANEGSILPGLIFSQWLAYFISLSNGLNPDQPANLKAVTRL